MLDTAWPEPARPRRGPLPGGIPVQPRGQIALEIIRDSADQGPISNFTITSRSDLEPETPPYDVRTLSSRVDGSLMVPRATMILPQMSAGLALVLTAVGVTDVLTLCGYKYADEARSASSLTHALEAGQVNP